MLRLLLCLFLALPAAAQPFDQRYEVFIRGIKAGDLTLRGEMSPSRYTAQGALVSSGLIGAFVDVSYRAGVSGSVSGGRLRPIQYVGEADTGTFQGSVDIRYSGDRISSVQRTPARERRSYDIEPSAQSGTLDPLSGMVAILLDAELAQACSRRVEIFDGIRRSRIDLGGLEQRTDGMIQCRGAYVRVAGFSERLMAERQQFPFTVIFSRSGDTLRVERFETDTTFGRASVVRR